jgi:hypothetical protein
MTLQFLNEVPATECLSGEERRLAMISMVLLIVLIVLLFGALPTWPYSREWGYYPSGSLGTVVVILLVLLLLGYI